MSNEKFDFAKHVSDQIDLLQQKAANEKAALRLEKMNEDFINNPDEPDFVKAVDRAISNVELEDRVQRTAQLEDRMIAKDLERNQ